MRSGIILSLLLLGFSLLGLAQTNDLGIWTTVGAEKKLGNWEINSETEMRTKTNSSEIDRWGISLGTNYSIIKPLKIGLSYDFLYFNDSEYLDFQPRHRVNLFLQGKQNLGNFTFTLRERIQLTAKDVSDRLKENGNIDNYKVNPEYTWRNKLKIDYDIPNFPINPAFSVESFYSLNNPDGNAFEQLRYSLSLNYKLTKHHKLELYGLFDDEFNVDTPVRRTVMGIAYQFSF